MKNRLKQAVRITGLTFITFFLTSSNYGMSYVHHMGSHVKGAAASFCSPASRDTWKSYACHGVAGFLCGKLYRQFDTNMRTYLHDQSQQKLSSQQLAENKGTFQQLVQTVDEHTKKFRLFFSTLIQKNKASKPTHKRTRTRILRESYPLYYNLLDTGLGLVMLLPAICTYRAINSCVFGGQAQGSWKEFAAACAGYLIGVSHHQNEEDDAIKKDIPNKKINNNDATASNLPSA